MSVFNTFRPIFAICPIDFYYQVIGVFKFLNYLGRFDLPKLNRSVLQSSTFRMGPAASGRGLCDIDRVLFRVAKSRFRKLGSPNTTEIYQ